MNGPRLSRARWLFLGAPAALLALGFVWYYGVEVPFWDEWDTPGRMLFQAAGGEITAGELWRQHNESRPVLPKLIVLLHAGVFGWKVKPFMVLSWVLSLAVFAALRRGVPGRRVPAGLLAVACAGLIFSPAQAESMLWGFQFTNLLPVLFVLLGLQVQNEVADLTRQYLLCAALALTATFAFTNGMVVWPLICPFFPALAARRLERRVLILTAGYLVVFGLTLALYFRGYVHPEGHPTREYVFAHPGIAASYFLAWLGGPLTRLGGAAIAPLPLAESVGAVILAGAALALGAGARRWRSLDARERLWLTLLAYGLISGGLTTLGRAGLGLELATSSRYSAFAMWVTVGILGWSATRLPRVAPVLAGGVIALLLPVWVGGTGLMSEMRRQRLAGAFALDLAALAPADPALATLHPDPARVRLRHARLLERGWSAPTWDLGWVPTAEVNPSDGGFYSWRETADGTVLVGWAADPRSREPLGAIFVFVRRGARRELLTGALVERARPDVVAALRSPAALHSGFEEHFPTPELFPGDELEVVGADLSARRLFRLNREPGSTR